MWFKSSILIMASPELKITIKDLKKAKKVRSLANLVRSIASNSDVLKGSLAMASILLQQCRDRNLLHSHCKSYFFCAFLHYHSL